MRRLHIIHHRASFGFAPPAEPSVYEATEFEWGRACGKIALAGTAGDVLIYDSLADAERALGRQGEVFVEEVDRR